MGQRLYQHRTWRPRTAESATVIEVAWLTLALVPRSDRHDQLPADESKEALQFLEIERRGLLLVLGEDQGAALIRPGDRLFAPATKQAPSAGRSSDQRFRCN